ncbi:MAG: M23 family metallopeptidase, partial [Chitinophagaceae bacterium]
LQKRVNEMKHLMQEIEKRDNEVYRVIFGTDPIPDENRQQFINSEAEKEEVAKMSNSEILTDLTKNLYTLDARIKVQGESFKHLSFLLKDQTKKLNSIPAIQPISNLQLNRISSGFGKRTDPIYKVIKFHQGIDFSAPMGTPIYATANGFVKTSGDTKNGYGIHVIINHGFGYKTLYGHMMKTNVRSGQSVKRGQIIGWLGNTGKSTAPHCHYEVHINNNPVDPINFFYNDLTPAQYEYLLKVAATSTQSMD